MADKLQDTVDESRTSTRCLDAVCSGVHVCVIHMQYYACVLIAVGELRCLDAVCIKYIKMLPFPDMVTSTTTPSLSLHPSLTPLYVRTLVYRYKMPFHRHVSFTCIVHHHSPSPSPPPPPPPPPSLSLSLLWRDWPRITCIIKASPTPLVGWLSLPPLHAWDFFYNYT